MNYETHPSGLNPEWEQNKEQNIAIAKRIDNLLVKGPGLVDTLQSIIRNNIGDLEEEQAVDVIESLEKQGLTKEDMPAHWKDMLAIRELTDGYSTILRHVDDRDNSISLGVGYHESAVGSETDDIDLWGFGKWVPKGINFPLYLVVRGTPSMDNKSPEFYASSIYGELPYQLIGADGLLYTVRNVYWFNTYGQGIKIEEIMRFEWDFEDERQEAEQKLTRVNFVPKEEHSRVMPLTPEDYGKINKMFEDIDAGLYKL